MLAPIQKLFEPEEVKSHILVGLEEHQLLRGLSQIINELNSIKKTYVEGIEVDYLTHYTYGDGFRKEDYTIISNIKVNYK